MNSIKWALLCAVFIVYLLGGGGIIMLLEQRHEISQNEQLHILRKDIQEILFRLDRDFYQNETSQDVLDAVASAKEGVLNRISDACSGKNFLATDESIEDRPLTWTFYNSVFFAFTAITTIGYGNLTPAMPVSRIFTILYALFGIPINGIIISGLSDYYSSKLVKAHKRSKDKRPYDARIVFIFDIIFYLIPGILVFIVAPAGFFVVIEKWSFIDSIYFCFVTLSTIGFGDYVAGLGDGHNLLLWLYKIVIIVWIMFGLGYLLMILTFITKGMTSKKVRTVIEKRLHGIKSTKEKLSKDIDYMRRVVQELYLMKVKPGEIETKAELTSAKPLPRRYVMDVRRNVSFNNSHCGNKRVQPVAFARCRSESALDSIDRDEIDRSADLALSDELMANLVSAITGNMNEIIHVVDQLNEYENNLNSEVELENDGNPDDGTADNDDILDDWRLEEFDSDEDLIEEEEEDLSETSMVEDLEQVIIHPQAVESKPETFMDKIGEAFRKISTGKRSVTDAPSRKISRNEVPEGSTQHDDSYMIHRGIPGRHTLPLKRDSLAFNDDAFDNMLSRQISRNPLARVASFNGPLNKIVPNEPTRRISTSRKVSNNSSKSSFEELNYFPYEPHYVSPHPRIPNLEASGRISTDPNICDSGRNKSSRERKSLQELLKALDTVQDRLHSGEFPERPIRTSMESHCEDARPQRRRRKVGIFNPGFSFTDSSFGKDSDKDKQHGL